MGRCTQSAEMRGGAERGETVRRRGDPQQPTTTCHLLDRWWVGSWSLRRRRSWLRRLESCSRETEWGVTENHCRTLLQTRQLRFQILESRLPTRPPVTLSP